MQKFIFMILLLFSFTANATLIATNDRNVFNAGVAGSLLLNENFDSLVPGAQFTSPEFRVFNTNNTGDRFGSGRIVDLGNGNLALGTTDGGPPKAIGLGNQLLFHDMIGDLRGVGFNIIRSGLNPTGFNTNDIEFFIGGINLFIPEQPLDLTGSGFFGVFDSTGTHTDMNVRFNADLGYVDNVVKAFGIIPEPLILLLFGIGLLSLGFVTRRKKI